MADPLVWLGVASLVGGLYAFGLAVARLGGWVLAPFVGRARRRGSASVAGDPRDVAL